MPTSTKPTLAELREQIKIESRVDGADNLDVFIDGVINEQLTDYAQKNKYRELLVFNIIITTIAATGAYDLPEDFDKPFMIRYRNARGYQRTLNSRPSYIDQANGTMPRWFDIGGDSISFFPFDDVPDDDTIILDYYKLPAMLTDDDIFPIPKLLANVKLETIRRVLIYHRKLNEAQVLKGDAVEMEARKRPHY